MPLEVDEIQNVSQSLVELPDAVPASTKRKVVALLASDIQNARDKGYTLKAIAQHLQTHGFDISYNTLRDALPRQKKSRSGKKKPRAAATADGTRMSGDGTRMSGDGTRMSGDGTRMSGDGTRMSGDGTRMSGDGTRTDRDGAPMRTVAPSNAPATREGAPAKSSRGALAEPGRGGIPPGAFERRPDLKDL